MNTLEEKKTNIKFDILAIVVIIILCFAIAPITLQNDTYYTLKIGELITQNGVDMQDHFSWHEDLPYTYPHWAYDTGLYLIYHLGEMTGLADGGMLFVYLSTILLACILGVLIYHTNKKLTKNSLISLFITLAVIYLLKDFIAARAQLVSYIIFVLEILFIENFLSTKKKRYLVGIVLLSIALANIHVAVWPFFFVLFLPYIAEFILAWIADKHILMKLSKWYIKHQRKSLEKKQEKLEHKQKEGYEKQIEKIKTQLVGLEQYAKEQEEKAEKIEKSSIKLREHPYKIKVEKNNAIKWLVLVMIICAFTGLLTPIGDTPYTYLIKTLQGNTTQSISEHIPLTLYNDKATMVVLALFLVILIFTDTKIKLRDLFMLAGLIFMAFMSRRQVSMSSLLN